MTDDKEELAQILEDLARWRRANHAIIRALEKAVGFKPSLNPEEDK